MNDSTEQYDLVIVNATEPIFGISLGPVPLRTHLPSECAGEFCCIHNPSQHHMRTWPQNWRSDRRLMERICPHGVGHPDPDDVAYQRRTFGDAAKYVDIHGCDGCCGRSDET